MLNTPQNDPAFFEQAFQDICKGDAEAYAFCRTFFNWVHVLDDLIDKDKEVSDLVTVGVSLRMIDVASSPFFIRNKASLMPVMLMAVGAFLDSQKLAKQDGVIERMASEVLKSQYQDVFYAVANLCGGLDHQLAMSEKYRVFSIG